MQIVRKCNKSLREIKRKDSYQFIRWGTLSPQKHKEASLPDEERTFHTAPVKYGIYAFPKGYIEPFLLGDSHNPDRCKNGRYLWLRDNDGNKITRAQWYESREGKTFMDDWIIKPEWIELLKIRGIKKKDIDFCFPFDEFDDEKWENDNLHYVIYSPPPKKFIYSGMIWHHLDGYYKTEHPWDIEKGYFARDTNDFKKIIPDKDILDRKGSWIKTTMSVYLRALKKMTTLYRWYSYFKGSSKENRHGNPHTHPFQISKDDFEVFIEKV